MIILTKTQEQRIIDKLTQNAISSIQDELKQAMDYVLSQQLEKYLLDLIKNGSVKSWLGDSYFRGAVSRAVEEQVFKTVHDNRNLILETCSKVWTHDRVKAIMEDALKQELKKKFADAAIEVSKEIAEKQIR